MTQAQKRLLKDLQEIESNNDLQYIFAQPLEDNIFEWHGNMVPQHGRYGGIILHFTMIFTEEYPYVPPNIYLSVDIPHCHVIPTFTHRNKLCLDLLNNYYWKTGQINQYGWSPSYSINTILIQMESFLFDKFVVNNNLKTKDTLYTSCPEKGGKEKTSEEACILINKVFSDSKNYSCIKCGHIFNKPFPPLKCSLSDQTTFKKRVDLVNNSKFKQILTDCYTKYGLNDRLNYYWFIEYIYTNINITDSILNYFLGGGLDLNFISNFSIKLNCKCKQCEDTLNKINIGKSLYDIDLETFLNIFIDNISKNTTIIWYYLHRLNYDDDLELYNDINIQNNQSIENKDLIKLSTINLEYLSDNTLDIIFNKLSDKSILFLSKTNIYFKKFLSFPEYNEKRKLICSYTKMNHKETILGYGLSINYDYISKDLYNIYDITSPLELLSYQTQLDNIHTSSDNYSFRFWLPCAINYKHYNKSKILLKDKLTYIYNNLIIQEINKGNLPESKVTSIVTKRYIEFKPLYALNIFSKLMSQMSNEIIMGSEYLQEKAINGYSQLHFTLLMLCKDYPEIIDLAETKINNFINYDRHRNKNYIPSLGELISYLSITNKYSWDDICNSLLSEKFCRDSYWIILTYPELAYVKYEKKEYYEDRIKKSFIATINDSKLIIINKMLYDNISKPYIKDSIDKGIKKYNKYYGFIPNTIKNDFHNKIKEINKIQSWKDFYQILNIDFPNRYKLSQILRNSIILSEKKKYHNLDNMNISISSYDYNRYSNNNYQPKKKRNIEKNWRIK